MAISPVNYPSSINFNHQLSEMPYASNHSSVSYASLINPNLPDNRLRENADRSIELIPKNFGYVIGESIHKVAGSIWSAVTESASRITKFVSSLNILPMVEAKEPEPEFIIIDASDSSDILSVEELEIIVHTASANRHMWSGNVDEALKEFKMAIEKVEICKEKCTPNFTQVLAELKANYKELKASYNVEKKRSTASQ